jgi:hypothetical protein
MEPRGERRIGTKDAIYGWTLVMLGSWFANPLLYKSVIHIGSYTGVLDGSLTAHGALPGNPYSIVDRVYKRFR